MGWVVDGERGVRVMVVGGVRHGCEVEGERGGMLVGRRGGSGALCGEAEKVQSGVLGSVAEGVLGSAAEGGGDGGAEGGGGRGGLGATGERREGRGGRWEGGWHGERDAIRGVRVKLATVVDDGEMRRDEMYVGGVGDVGIYQQKSGNEGRKKGKRKEAGRSGRRGGGGGGDDEGDSSWM